jgi:hypothetical protein
MEAPCHAVMIKKKDVLESLEKWKRKMEKCANGKMYMKNNGTYFSLNKWIFCTTVYNSFVPLVKGNVKQLFLESNLTNNFH